MKTLFYAFSLLVIVSCQKHETREQKYFNGQLQEQYQVVESDGSFLKDGTYKSWFTNGQIEKEGGYLKNKKNGIWKSWNVKGEKSLEENYIEDSLNGNSTLWYSNGKKWMEENM